MKLRECLLTALLQAPVQAGVRLPVRLVSLLWLLRGVCRGTCAAEDGPSGRQRSGPGVEKMADRWHDHSLNKMLYRCAVYLLSCGVGVTTSCGQARAAQHSLPSRIY